MIDTGLKRQQIRDQFLSEVSLSVHREEKLRESESQTLCSQMTREHARKLSRQQKVA